MRALSGMACIVTGLAIIGTAFDVQATIQAGDGFLRANPSDEVAGKEDVDHRALSTTSDNAPPMCDNGFTGIQNGDVCCSAQCGTCGGFGCGDRPGGRNACCTGRILNTGSSCSDVTAAPCFIDGPTCENGFPGIQTRNVCCSAECGRCGGTGCGGLPGGNTECCTSVILADGESCSVAGQAPCFIEDPPAPTPPPTPISTCSNGFPGFQNGNVCCAVQCGLCGGVGCSAAPGGQDSCCTSAITTNGEYCDDVDEAPCLI